jgi:hypothetical protein
VPFVLESPPKRLETAVRVQFELFVQSGMFQSPPTSDVRRDSVRLALPHQMYGLGLPARDGALNIESARFVGWRYLIVDEETVLGAVHVRRRDKRESVERLVARVLGRAAQLVNPRFADYACSFIQGELPTATGDALRWVEDNFAPTRETPYHLRLLSIPMADVAALWLIPVGATVSQIIPLAPEGIDGSKRRLSRWTVLDDKAFLEYASRRLHPVSHRGS